MFIFKILASVFFVFPPLSFYNFFLLCKLFLDTPVDKVLYWYIFKFLINIFLFTSLTDMYYSKYIISSTHQLSPNILKNIPPRSNSTCVSQGFLKSDIFITWCFSSLVTVGWYQGRTQSRLLAH